MGRWGATFAAGFWLALTACAIANAGEAKAPLPSDPTVRRGVLANGLRYALKENANPEGALSFRLAFDVGSLEEAEHEVGAAHFVEHMAFRASRHFPEGELDPAFAPLGVSFGRDQNAFTLPGSTAYFLDLPRSGRSERALALRWLRDVADGVSFAPDAVDRERGVVLAERGVRLDPAALTAEAVAAFHGPELRTTHRPPLGTPASIKAMTPATLEAFYRRWYRPDQAVLVVVGDAGGLADIEAEIAAAFGDWQASGPAPQPVSLPGPDAQRGLDAFVSLEARVAPDVSVCRLAPGHRPRTDMADARDYIAKNLWHAVLNERLVQLSRTEPSILNIGLFVYPDARDATKICVEATTIEGGWDPALKAIQGAIDQFSADGVGEAELEQALVYLRGLQLGLIITEPTRSSDEVATDLAAHELDGSTPMTARDALSVFNRAAEELTEQKVTDAWRRDWSQGGPLLAVAAAAPPEREAVIAAWSRAGDPARAAAPAHVTWAYGDPGPPGRVVGREVIAEGEFVRLTFSNGLVLNFKQTSAIRGVALVRADFGAGREDLGETTLSEANFVAENFVLGGLGRHSHGDLRVLFGDEVMAMELRVSNHSFALVARSFISNLPDQLLLMSAYLRDPGFREDLDPKIPTMAAHLYRSRAASPRAMARAGIDDLLGGSRGDPSPKLTAIRSRDFAAKLRAPVTTASLELSLVGDLDEESAVELVAGSLGRLPPRLAAEARPPYAGYSRFPPASSPVRRSHDGPADKAAIMVAWPIFVASPERRREQRALELLTIAFNDALRSDLRTSLGRVYAPQVELEALEQADQGAIYATVEASPGDLPQIEAEIRAVADRLAAGDLDQQMLEAARAQLLAGNRAARANLEQMAWSIRSATRNPEGPGILNEEAQTLSDLTLAEVRDAAATWLAATPIIVTATPESSK